MVEAFELLDESDIGLLDERERRLVIGAAHFRAFTRPGQICRFTVLRGAKGTVPSLTDKNCRNIEWEDDHEAVGVLVARGLMHRSPLSGDLVDLTIDVGGDPEVASAYHQLTGLAGRARRAIRFLAPIQFDVLRQLRTDLVERHYRTHPQPRKAPCTFRTRTQNRSAGRTPAVLFGMHWLELGGAERWALDCVRMAKEAGLTPIVIADQPSTHPWITRPELDDAVIIPLTLPIGHDEESALLSGILSTFDVRGIHVHHCTWLYARLPWIRSIRPDIPIVDSLHILEWRTGGFVDMSVRQSNVIDVHHVVSPQLRDYLVGKQGIESSRVALGTLARLATTGLDVRSQQADDTNSSPFVVAFVGRFTQQKRPYLFLQLAAALKSSSPRPVRFIVHGDGELVGEVHALRTRFGLGKLVQLRGPDQPVSDTFADASALVISSDNEGLTLTSFEAVAAGVPVISADVGSQASVVADELLCPRHPYPFVKAAARRIRAMMTSPKQRKRWLEEQETKAEAFLKLPDASDWARDLYRGWSA